mmetsp:Transcript_10111/g.28244  ORF Transcript_10111/g.28244 Transcript_10111/m.28244 type:complete len:88 (+) Transcript_10111:458-721(+)
MQLSTKPAAEASHHASPLQWLLMPLPPALQRDVRQALHASVNWRVDPHGQWVEAPTVPGSARRRAAAFTTMAMAWLRHRRARCSKAL